MKSINQAGRRQLVFKVGSRGLVDQLARLEEQIGLKLSDQQRLLLGHSGFVEQVLEILFGPVAFKVLEQHESREFIIRQSKISSLIYSTDLIKAHAGISKAALNSKVVDQIREKKNGLGSILVEQNIEHMRKITQIGYDFDVGCPFRRYIIVHQGRPAIRIMEFILLSRSLFGAKIIGGPGGI